VVAWLSGSTLVLINEVTLRLVSTGMGDRQQACKTTLVYDQPLRPTQPSTLSDQSAVMLCSLGVKAGMVHSLVDKRVGGR